MPSPRELLEPFLLELGLSLNPSTVGAYRYQLGRFFEFLDLRGVSEVGQLTADDLSAYRFQLDTTISRYGKPLATSSKQHSLQVAKTFLNWADRAGYTLARFDDGPVRKAPQPTNKRVYSKRCPERGLPILNQIN